MQFLYCNKRWSLPKQSGLPCPSCWNFVPPMPHSECLTIKADNQPHNDSIYLNTTYHHIFNDQFTSQYLNCSQSRSIKYDLALEIAHANSCRMQADTFFSLFITNLVTFLQAIFNSAMIDNLDEYNTKFTPGRSYSRSSCPQLSGQKSTTKLMCLLESCVIRLKTTQLFYRMLVSRISSLSEVSQGMNPQWLWVHWMWCIFA